MIENTGLVALGLEGDEERIYVALLKFPGSTASELCERVQRPRRAVDGRLRRMVEQGLLTHSPEASDRYFPLPPDIVVESLIHQRQAELNAARAITARLRLIADASPDSRVMTGRPVEVLRLDAAPSVVAQMLKAARSDLIVLERLPLRISPSSVVEEAHAQLLARGVRSRAVTDSELLQAPGMTAKLRREITAGEGHRIVSGLPIKMTVIDRRVGIVLPIADADATDNIMIVRSPSLLDALYELFEMFWAAALPISFDANGDMQIASADWDDDAVDARLLSLLAAGLNNKSIQSELAIPQRSFTRRIAALSKTLGASTRFHAGWIAARRLGKKRGAPGP